MMATIQPATELSCIRKVGDIVHTFHKHAHIKCGNQIDQQVTRPPLVSMGIVFIFPKAAFSRAHGV